nr:hypothetical protein [Tanacetum cinerariifolium]
MSTIIHHRCHLRQPAPIHQPPPLQRHHTAIPSSLNHHTTQPATSRRSTVAGTTTPPPLPLDTINSRCLAAKAEAAASTAGSQPADVCKCHPHQQSTPPLHPPPLTPATTAGTTTTAAAFPAAAAVVAGCGRQKGRHRHGVAYKTSRFLFKFSMHGGYIDLFAKYLN